MCFSDFCLKLYMTPFRIPEYSCIYLITGRFVKIVTFLLLVLCNVLLTVSCVNNIDETLTEGTIPIIFKARMTRVSATVTRATATGFEKGDEMGLYALQASGRMDESRYIDNLKLVCGESNLLIPERPVFYPEDDVELDFMAYYPYRAEAVPQRSSALDVEVSTDQSTPEGRMVSDFLLASAAGVGSSDKAVELKFRHQFTKLKIVLTPEEGESAEEMLNAQPRIIATGFGVKAMYDFQSKRISSVQRPQDIIPHGEWQVKNNSLRGKEFIVIPQEEGDEPRQFVLEWKGRVYLCPMPIYEMQGGTQCEINIAVKELEGYTLTGVLGSIEDWTTVEGQTTESGASVHSVYLNALSFAHSNVYRVYSSGRPAVEICKEYLNSEMLTSVAVTAYPVKADGRADLARGVLLRLPDSQADICGGRISWNEADNTFAYEQGQLSAVDKFYLDADGEIVTEKPENPLPLNVLAHKLRDIRGGELTEYPIVKIGTQYWMRKELCATLYRDGTPIARRTALGTGAGYLKPDAYDICLYNGEAVLEGQLAPGGWKIPSDADWERLKRYVKDDASLLKAGTWKKAQADGVPHPALNYTCFGAYPLGVWIQGFNLPQEFTGYWTLNAGSAGDTIPARTVFLSSSSVNVQSGGSLVPNTSHYKGLSVRCLQE